jgi:beta-glucosidase
MTTAIAVRSGRPLGLHSPENRTGPLSMTTRSTFARPPHISERAWALAGRMTLRQLAGQLTSIDPGRYLALTGEDIALAVARGEIGCTGLVGDRLGELQEAAVANGHPPLLVKDDGRRGFYLVAPFPLYCFDLGLIRRAHEEAATDAHRAGVTLVRLTCDYAFAQNQGRTQEGGLISCPRFMSEVTRASTEGLRVARRMAVILKHFGPYQYTAGPDYTALPIERTEFLETVLPRYAGGFEAGADGVMMSFVALTGVPAHADPYLRDLAREGAGPGAIIESDYDGIYELYGGFGYAESPKEAALRAFREGGVHIDLCSLLYLRHLPELVEEGRIGEEELRVRVAELLGCKERVGLLDAPVPGTDPGREQALLAGPVTARRALALASVVLLRPARPDPAVLPVPTGVGVRMCVLGPLAEQDPEDWLGAYSSHANRHLERVTTPLAGIRRHWPEAAYARGCDYDRAAEAELDAAAEAAADATHVAVFLGEPHAWSGESATLAEPRVPEAQRRLVERVRRSNPRAKLIVFVTAGRALHIPREVEANADAIFWTAHLGSFAGDAVADILAGVASPTARLSHGLPIADGITSGFDTRQARTDRPPVPVVPGSAARRQRHHWCAYYLGLGARWPAAYYFGEGYGYTSFELSDWSLASRTLSASAGSPVTATVRVTNTGSFAGTETVHLYYQDMVCEERVPRLLERLGHRQVTLGPGESATLAFTVTADMLAKYGRDPDAGRRAWPDRNPAENPDRLFLVQHEGQALDAIERFGDAPCVLAFTLVP